MKTKIIFSLLLLCLLAFPCSAWELGFEEHPDDEFSVYGTDVCTLSGFYLASSGTNSRIYYSGTTSTSSFTAKIHLPVEDYLAFSVTTAAGNTANTVSVSFFNGTTQVGSRTIYSIYSSITTSKRITITKGTGSTWYYVLDGAGGGTFSIPDGEQITSFMVSVSNGANTQKTYTLDDFSTDDTFQLGFDSPTATGSQLTVTYGTHPIAGFEFTRTLEDSDGNIISSSSFSSTTGSFTLTTPSIAGIYTFRIRGVDSNNPDSPNYIFYSKKLFLEGTEEIDSLLELNKDTYAPGEICKIFTHISPYSAGNYIVVDGPGSSDSQQFSITSEDQTFSYTVPSNSVEGRGVVILRNSAGSRLDYVYYDVSGGIGSDSSVSFDKQGYVNTDKIEIWYSDLPAGCQVQLTGTKSGSSTKVINQVYTKSGKGVFYYQLSGEDIDSLYVVAAYDGELLNSDSATVANGDDYVIYGTVYDANTLAPISGASVAVGGWVKYTDEVGRYDMSVGAGTKNLVVGADGYNTLSTSINIISVSTQKNIYLVPITASEGETGIIYGACADYDTGQAIETAYIQISNSTGVTYSALGRSSTGSYVFEGLPNGSTWTLKASKTGYDNYQKTITVDGSTFHLIRLVSQDSSSTSGDDEDGDSTETTTERPGRESAKNAMKEFEALVPGLISLVGIKVFKELMK